MISAVLYALERGVSFVRKHPQLLFAIFLLAVLPLSFLRVSYSFLEVAEQNTDSMAHQRVGLLSDVFVTLVKETNFQTPIIQAQIESVVEQNPDITKFRVISIKDGNLVTVAALDQRKIGQDVEDKELQLYEQSIAHASAIIFPFTFEGRDILQSFRVIKDGQQAIGFIFVEIDQTQLNQVFESRLYGAVFQAILLLLFLMVLAYWLFKLTDYRYLYQEVKKANEMKDLFTNMIAHELRAPLTAIRGYSSMTLEAAQNEEAKKYSERISLSSERLIAIVNDLLDVARLQSGKLSVELKEGDVLSVVTAVTDELRVSATEKGIGLELKAEPGEYVAMIDEQRLHQAVTNLVSNAIKYTKQGSITLRLEDKTNELELRVEDTGMGISAEDQKKLFAPFFRVKSNDVSLITGTGLGMWITKQLMELMGASIGVESIKGVGTHIVVKIPKKARKQA